MRQRKSETNWFAKLWPLLVAGAVAICASFPAFQTSYRTTKEFPLAAANTPTPTAELPKVGFGMDRTQVDNTAQDGTGDIWAIKSWTTDAFFKWNGTTWAQQSFEATKGYSPLGIQRVQDGAVLCVWIQGGNDTYLFLLTEHKGSTSRVLARWNGERRGLVRLFRSPHATWITFWGAQIYRVENDTATRLYDLKPAQVFTGNPDSDSTWVDDNPLEILEDARGHTWFWSNEFEGGFNQLSLRGLLEFDGQKWIYHPRLQGLPDKPLTALVARDEHTLWLAVGDGGLFEFDTKTLVGKRVTDPVPHAFDEVQTIRQIGGTWYLIANAPESLSPGGDSSQRQSDVWRWRPSSTSKSGGNFEHIMRGLDYGGEFSDRPNRPIVPTKTGLWIGALSGGAWWLPFDQTKPPIHIDWRQGLLFPNVNALFQRNDGSLLANAQSGTVPDLRPYLGVATAPNSQTFTVYGFLTEDRQHHLWRVANLRDRVVQEWDGTRWNSYPIPASYPLSSLFYLSQDAQGRIWCLPISKNEPTAILTPTKRSWQFFPTFQQALQNQLKLFGATRFIRLKISLDKYQSPRAFAPNKLAFRSPDEELCFFDGQKWHTWTARDIMGKEFFLNYDWEGTPYFNATGVLCADMGFNTWQWAPKTGWTAHEYNPDAAETPTPTPPPNSGIHNPDSIVRDSSGAIWMLKNRQLWKAAWGLCEPQFTTNENHPLRDGRQLAGVKLDPHGTPLLVTGEAWHYEYVWLPSAPSDTRLSVTPQSQDTFNLRFIALPQNREKHWFRWRLDAGKWSEPQIDSTILLTIRTAGTHRFEVATINSHLRLDNSPATTILNVPRMSPVQLAHFLSRLSSPSYNERERAIKDFARQPATALPFLRAARRTANPDLGWWIDAALQECERHTEALTKPQ